MLLKTVTWNIGAGNLLETGKDPTLLSSYTVEGIDSVVDKLAALDADVIALQEVEGAENTNQVAYIANRLGYKDFFFDATSDSHLHLGMKLGNGLISRHPVSGHRSGTFLNPNVTFELEGKTIQSHDKGYGQCVITVGSLSIKATTLHLLPFRKMGINLDSEQAIRIYQSVATELEADDEFQLIQGDFNISSSTVGNYLTTLFERNKLLELSLAQATTPKDRKYDHVLYRGLRDPSVEVDSTVGTDHYPVTCTFQIP